MVCPQPLGQPLNVLVCVAGCWNLALRPLHYMGGDLCNARPSWEEVMCYSDVSTPSSLVHNGPLDDVATSTSPNHLLVTWGCQNLILCPLQAFRYIEEFLITADGSQGQTVSYSISCKTRRSSLFWTNRTIGKFYQLEMMVLILTGTVLSVK
ncbi:hypothetical protein EI94DRAFT_1699723 [Lactarius quietus]|nr:hypothetical protein EI94DRAFT_1699723 [Lactarius quietus]